MPSFTWLSILVFKLFGKREWGVNAPTPSKWRVKRLFGTVGSLPVCCKVIRAYPLRSLSCSFALLLFRSFVLSVSRSFVLSFFRSLVLLFFRSFVLSFFRSLVSRSLASSLSRYLVLSFSRYLLLSFSRFLASSLHLPSLSTPCYRTRQNTQ